MRKVFVLLVAAMLMSVYSYAQNSNQESSENEKRIRIKELEPKVYEIMGQFEKFLDQSDLSKTHKELIKIRASQLNGCGYCLNLHSKDALVAGESEARIYMLPLWKKVPQFYTDEELVVLQMTEEITLINNGLSHETYKKAMTLFSKDYVAQLITAIITINSWNRIAISTEMEDECSL